MQQRKPKNVVIFRKELLPLSETFILDQFLSYKTWTPHLAGYRLCEGLDITSVPAFTLEGCIQQPFQQVYLKAFQHLQYLGISSPAFKRYLEKTNANIVHAHFGYDAILVYDAAMALKLPLVVTLHGSDILCPPEIIRNAGGFFRCYPKKLEVLLNDKRVFFIAVSNALREGALKRGVPAHRCVVRYTGANEQYFSPETSGLKPSNRVLFVGRLAKFKGCDFLLKAMAIVRKRTPNVELIIIGDGAEKAKLVSMSNDLGVNALFLGALPREEVRRWIRNSRTLCLPSVTEDESFETFGMVLLEAQFCGVPSITSARGGSESIIHGETGFIFAERDYEALANYITTLLTDDDLYNRFSKEARNHVLAHFTLDECTRRIEEYYDEILS